MKIVSSLIEKVDPIRRKITNRSFLAIFLALCIITLILKIIDGILLDLGYRQGEVHLNYWHVARIQEWVEVANPQYKIHAIQAYERHPNTLWFLTQFTWLTTIMIILYLTVRLFLREGSRVPRWMSWIVTQRTLTLITIYDLIVGIVFWSAIYSNFEKEFNPDLRAFQIFYTVIVHTVIPVILAIYSTIFLIRDRNAAILRGKFVFRAMLWPLIYMMFYILLTIVWNDPYTATSMHFALIADGWAGWTSELWKFAAAIIGIYILIGVLTTAHNLILVKFNKIYDPNNDSEMIAEFEAKIRRIQAKARRDFNKSNNASRWPYK